MKGKIANHLLKILCCSFVIAVVLSCTEKGEKEISFAKKIGKKHQNKEFLNHNAIRLNIEIFFGEKSILKGLMTFKTNSSKGIIELESGGKLFINKEKAYYTSELEELNRKRFHAYTWSYFLLLPYKLNDPGTIWTDIKLDTSLDNFNYKKLTFGDNIGDTPKDWYILFADKKTGLLDHVSYIVSYGKSLEKAESDPHAIEYSDYKNVRGVPISHHWTFKEWTKKDGLVKKVLGKAIISDVQFIEDFSGSFSIPNDAIEINK